MQDQVGRGCRECYTARVQSPDDWHEARTFSRNFPCEEPFPDYERLRNLVRYRTDTELAKNGTESSDDTESDTDEGEGVQ